MPQSYSSCKLFFRASTIALFCLCFCSLITAQSTEPVSRNQEIYSQIKAFPLTGGTVDVSNLVLKRDRVSMTFNGTFYFASPVEGKVTGAVFVGQGMFQAEVPPGEFEKDTVKLLLNADNISSGFRTAVLRFTDDTFDIIGKNAHSGAAPDKAVKLASDTETRILTESGANISSRLALSILNSEKPGFFFGDFDSEQLGRFSYVFDPQARIPTNTFGVNAGEKGLIFSYKPVMKNDEVWTAFYSLDDYQKGSVEYSDAYDLIDITHYDMDIDLRAPKEKLGLRTKMSFNTIVPNVRAIPFTIGESLSASDNQRLKKQMRLKSVRLDDKNLDFVQEDWESGLTVFLPEPTKQNQKFDLTFEFEGDFMQQTGDLNSHYPRSNTAWYPRHGFLDRATYDFTYFHSKNLKVASVGTRESEAPNVENKDVTITKYSMKHPVALVTFALGPFKRYAETIKWDDGSTPIPIEFNSLPGEYLAIKEDFILAELNNSVRYFYALFGKYPYDTYSATFHPFGFGQGFPSMLVIPAADNANKHTYSFISHETAHQWWGNIVAWRSYRDQWLSEGFADYSGLLYTAKREGPGASRELLNQMRESLKITPRTLTGVGKGKINDVGPIILGHRLNTSKSLGAYQTLIYGKGALVLRMLHFLFTDPSSGDGGRFFEMMKDFVNKYRNNVASTDDFRMVANEHFIKTPIAQKYGLKNLDWFFDQWVYRKDLPSYRLEYTIEAQPDKTYVVSGTIYQENTTGTWFMPIPVAFTYENNQYGRGTIAALNEKTPFKLKLPTRPTKMELDPDKWILSEKTSGK